MGGNGDRSTTIRGATKKLLKRLHAALDGDGIPPDEWVLSRICDEFNCTPREAALQPTVLTLTIIDMRAYANTKHALDNTKNPNDLEQTDYLKMVQLNELELYREAQS